MKILILTLSLCLASGLSLHAQVYAGFDDQTNFSTSFTSNNTGEQTAVDQWSGIAGDGWTNPWLVSTNASSVRDKQARNVDPLTGDSGTYMQFRMSATNNNSRQWANSRTYTSNGGFDVNASATYSFLYRPDDISSFAGGGASFIQIKDGGGIFSNSGVTWFIDSRGGTTKTWQVGNGDGIGGISGVDSGLQINAGDTYQFTIVSNPTTDTWDVTIDNLDDASGAFSTAGLGYVFDNTQQAGNLVFLSQISTLGNFTYNYDYSVDSISIVPEPSSAALLLGGMGLALARMGRRRRSGKEA